MDLSAGDILVGLVCRELSGEAVSNVLSGVAMKFEALVEISDTFVHVAS